MFVYNVTVKVDHSISKEWKEWMLSEHMPEMVETGCFVRSYLLKLHEVDETDGITYAAQYFANSKADYNRYIEEHAGILREKAIKKWGNKFIAFRSLMEIVQ
jgi:hypothetical protein